MTGDRNLFTKLEEKGYGDVRFGDNNKGKIICRGIIGINPKIYNVSLVKGLKFNLISMSQLYDKGMDVKFRKKRMQYVEG